MAAGLGFKDFTTGEVLTAADVDGYLMQGIWVFASTAARDASVTSPSEGNFAFTKDTNSLWYYDGAAWVASGATGDIEGVTAGIGISGGGTSGTVTVTNSMATAIDAKGDLVAGTGADTFAKLTVGANDTILTADSSTATGLKWATASGSSGPAFRAFRQTSSQSVSAATWTKAQLQGETFDTDSCYDSTTNYRFTPTKAGYYQFNSTLFHINGGVMNIAIYKNGTFASNGNTVDNSSGGNGAPVVSDIIYLNGSTDYAEIYTWNNLAFSIYNNSSDSFFSGIWIRS
jgi:hypothetical protein